LTFCLESTTYETYSLDTVAIGVSTEVVRTGLPSTDSCSYDGSERPRIASGYGVQEMLADGDKLGGRAERIRFDRLHGAFGAITMNTMARWER
jgi:hypothetical protein